MSSPFSFGIRGAKSAPIAGLEGEEEVDDEDEEEEEEDDDDEEEEYTYEEEEEEDESNIDGGKGDEDEEDGDDDPFDSSEEEEWRRLVEVPEKALQVEAKWVQLQRKARYWMPDAEKGFRICELVEDGGQAEGEEEVEVELRGSEGEEDEEEEEEEPGRKKRWRRVGRGCLQRLSVSHLCEDMCQLSELNEPSVLANIQTRYRHRLIHTYSGLFCVVVNPWCPLPSLYSPRLRDHYASVPPSNLPPHVFSVAQNAFDGINCPSGSDQSILITGESGAGKTENTRRIIEYLTEVAGPRQGAKCPEGTATVGQTLVSAGIALEAFANAQTVHNSNSSRVGKFTRIDFDRGGRLLCARIDCYLLEKSRVVSQNPGDRNFHIFYRLLANPDFLRSEKGFRILCRIWDHRNGGKGAGQQKGPSADGMHFLNQGGTGDSVHAKFVDDLEEGRQTEVALDQLDFSTMEKAFLREMVTACILVGQIRFGERQGLDVSFVEDMTEVEAVAQLLAVSASALVDALTQPSIRVGDVLIRRSQPLRKTLSSAQSLAKFVYERTVRWVLAKCNEAIVGGRDRPGPGQCSTDRHHFIGVLDMAGFEIMDRNSFEQLCINYTNERLQQFFNEFMFVREQEEYRREGIGWEHQDYGNDLQPTIDLIEKPLGILSLLQEECIVPNGSDQALLDKFVRRLSSFAPGVFSKAKQSSRTPSHHHFTIAHYAGPVSYSIDGWLEKNRDTVDANLLAVLAASAHPLASRLFPAATVGAKSSSPRGTRAGPAMTQAAISHVYREQLAQLMRTFSSTRAQFIRCIVPNHQRLPFVLKGPLVMHQLRCNGVLEGIRICRRGFPTRIRFPDFLLRFRILHPPSVAHHNNDPRGAVSHLCQTIGLDPARYQIGATKIFCRVGLISELETLRSERVHACMCKLQAWIRWGLVQRDFGRRREEFKCFRTIQDAVRRQLRLRQWTWFRLWLKVRQLIPLAMQRRRMAELEAENAELRARSEQAQRELARTRTGLGEAEERAEKAEVQRMKERRRTEELSAELRRSEELLERMERKFDDQHTKIVRLNGTLGEVARALERMEEEKGTLQKEQETLHEKYRLECIERESAEESLRVAQEENVKRRMEADEAEAEMRRMRAEAEKRTEELGESQQREGEQQEELAELNRTLAETNERLGEMQPQLHAEKSARRKAEGLADELEAELSRMSEELDKTNAKREIMMEQIRARDAQVRKLERKLEDKGAEMEECVAELRRTHKRGQTELQEQLEEMRRKGMRMEAENAQLRCKLEAQAQDTAIQLQKSRSRVRLDRFDSNPTLDSQRDNNRDSSVDSDGGGAEGTGALCPSSLSFSRPSPGLCPCPGGSLHRRFRFPGPPFDLRRSVSGTSSSIGHGSSAPSSSTSSSCFALRRHATSASANPMITSLVTTVDSGCLLTRSPSSASTISGSFQQNQSLTMTQKFDGAERRAMALERELQQQRQDGQMAKRELEVYKQSFQEAERARDSLSKKIRSLNSELDSMGRALKVQEERTHSTELEARKWREENGTLRKRMEEEGEERRVEMARERKKHAEKVEQMGQEYDTRLRQLTTSQRSTEQLQKKLAEAESQLDKALSQLSQMERLQKTQNSIGLTWESQYRSAQSELEGVRDENAALKSRIRRQQRQIELLTQQSEMDSRMDELEERMGKLGSAKTAKAEEAEGKAEEGEEDQNTELVVIFNNNC